jgi:hypothetical protein
VRRKKLRGEIKKRKKKLEGAREARGRREKEERS